MKNKIKVAVIGGGISNERAVSLRSARQVFDNLPKHKYLSTFIDIKKDGRWFYDSKKPVKLYDTKFGYKKSDLKKFDVAFIALHGRFGEDGKIQALLEIVGLPYTGSGVLASSLALNKAKTNEVVKLAGFQIPKSLVLQNNFSNFMILKEVVDFPCFVKPNQSGSSVGIYKVKNMKELSKAVKLAFKEDNIVLVDEYIDGREITCGIMGNASHHEMIILPPVEIVSKNTFFDYESKYDEKLVDELCPAPITKAQAKKVQELSKKIHLLIGCDGLTRTDFILKNNKFYFLEINTIPGMTAESICPKEVKVAGISFAGFLDKQIKLALSNKAFTKMR